MNTRLYGYFLTIIIAVFVSTTLSAQTAKQACNCPKNNYAGEQPDTSFRLSNDKTIVLCGYRNPDSRPMSFSEFVLAVCGQDTIIDFWDATLTCRLKVKHDTLVVEHLKYLPTGKNFENEESVWSIEKLYFNGKKTVSMRIVNKQMPKYDAQQIKNVLDEYTRGKTQTGRNELLPSLLFVAAISGNRTARKYFKEYQLQFGQLDGGDLEEYKDLVAMLESWD